MDAANSTPGTTLSTPDHRTSMGHGVRATGGVQAPAERGAHGAIRDGAGAPRERLAPGARATTSTVQPAGTENDPDAFCSPQTPRGERVGTSTLVASASSSPQQATVRPCFEAARCRACAGALLVVVAECATCLLLRAFDRDVPRMCGVCVWAICPACRPAAPAGVRVV